MVAQCSNPELIKGKDFPDDVKAKAKKILDGCKGNSIGSYSESTGLPLLKIILMAILFILTILSFVLEQGVELICYDSSSYGKRGK